MSLSASILSKHPLATVGDWQAAIDAAGFKLFLDDDAQRPISDLGGHLPAAWEGREAGFECYPGDVEAADFAEDCEVMAVGGPWSHVLDIHYVGFANSAGVAIAGAVYAHATGGFFWEGEGGERVDADVALAYARRIEGEIREFLRQEDARMQDTE